MYTFTLHRHLETRRYRAVLQWKPVHTGIHGNEVAYQLAKEGSKNQQSNSKLSYQRAKTLIRNKRLADLKQRNGGYSPQQDTLRLLSRHQQTTIFRLRIPATSDCVVTWQRLELKSPLPLRTGSTDHNPCPTVMPSPQERKRKYLANRKFPRKQTPWNSHRPTPWWDCLHRTLKILVL